MDYRDTLHDLVWDMLGRGCAYWAYATGQGCDTPDAHEGAEPWDRCAGCWTTVRLHEEADGYEGEYRIDGPAIERGVNILAGHKVDEFAFDGVPIARAWRASLAAGGDVEVPSAENRKHTVSWDEGDDDWADWVTQFGVFGEIVFG